MNLKLELTTQLDISTNILVEITAKRHSIVDNSEIRFKFKIDDQICLITEKELKKIGEHCSYLKSELKKIQGALK